MPNIIKVLKTTLKGSLSTTGLSFTVQKFVDSKGVEVAYSDFGGNFVVVIEQGTNIEIVKCTGITQSGSDTTAVITIHASGRHLNPKSPYTGGATGLAFTSGANVIVTNDPYTMSLVAKTDLANTWALLQTFTLMPKCSDVPTDNDHLINKLYADALVLGTLTTINVVVPATAGEAVASGELVYYDTTDKEWKLCDATTASTVDNVLLGIAQGAGTDGVAITGGVLLRGMDSKQAGMTAGDVMYASDTAGAIVNSAGTVEVAVGIAKSATDLYFNPRFNQQLTEDQQDALAGNNGTPATANLYITQTGLQRSTEVYAVDAEATDTYVVTLSPAPTAYVAGMTIRILANTVNTGASTINVNALGAKAITKNGTTALADGDIRAGQVITLVYDGTQFQIQSLSKVLTKAQEDLLVGGADASSLHTHSTGKIGVGHTDVAVSNTTSETNLISVAIPANTLSTNNAVKVRIWFTLSSTTVTMNRTIRLKFGSTTIATDVFGGSLGNTGYDGFIDALLVSAGSTSAQEGSFYLLAMNTVSTSFDFKCADEGTSAEDSTGALNLIVSLQNASAEPNETFTMKHYVVEVIK